MDWRLETSEAEWMYGAELERRRFASPTPDWDHEHCRLCWATFMEVPHEDALQEGYVLGYRDRSQEMPALKERSMHHSAPEGGYTSVYTPTEEVWICPQCIQDFKEHFGWSVTQP